MGRFPLGAADSFFRYHAGTRHCYRCNHTPLPEILIGDFGYGDVQAITKAVFQAFDDLTFIL